MTQLRDTALDHADELFKTMDEGELLSRLKNASLAGDHARLEEYADKFAEHAEHVQEVCRLLYHVASTEALQVTAKNTDACLKVYGSQVHFLGFALIPLLGKVELENASTKQRVPTSTAPSCLRLCVRFCTRRFLLTFVGDHKQQAV